MSEIPRRLPSSSVTANELREFVATHTGTGNPTNIAHGLGTAPQLVWWSVLNGANGSGAAGTQTPTVTEGTHTATNIVITCTAGAIIKIHAVK